MSDSRRDFESVKLVLSIWGFALIFTLVSGSYVVSPLVLDSQIDYHGFPLFWLEISRSTWVPNSPWHYNFLWFWFIVDLAVNVILVLAAVAIYDKTLRNVNKTKLYKAFFLASSIGFVILCWFLPLLGQTIYALVIPNWRNYRLLSVYPYFLAELTVVYVWSLMKYRETIRRYRKVILAAVIAIIAILVLSNVIYFLTMLSR